MVEPLSDEEIAERIPDGWERDGDEIVRTYEFDEYMAGLAHASVVGEIAEAENHHPIITIDYEEVEVRLTTHEADGITERDLDMAELFETEVAG